MNPILHRLSRLELLDIEVEYYREGMEDPLDEEALKILFKSKVEHFAREVNRAMPSVHTLHLSGRSVPIDEAGYREYHQLFAFFDTRLSFQKPLLEQEDRNVGEVLVIFKKLEFEL